ncbi:MAG: hypothetical protein CW691_05415 [Candidatus Bathyarchaeum sp.]|nr:MAG: hypothetical protein CW691_05415 [Candidatus Bathyarchaeum sp.]
MNAELIAPCGMNCAVCSNYLALKNDVRAKGVKLPYCKGCRPRDKKCSFIKKKCEKLLSQNVEFCYECEDFPCNNLKQLEKKYIIHYRTSMVDNLVFIRDYGLLQFLESQKKKWQCPDCGEIICCHNGICYSCGLEQLRNKKKKYRWED